MSSVLGLLIGAVASAHAQEPAARTRAAPDAHRASAPKDFATLLNSNSSVGDMLEMSDGMLEDASELIERVARLKATDAKGHEKHSAHQSPPQA